jgi:hypothetical protein
MTSGNPTRPSPENQKSETAQANTSPARKIEARFSSSLTPVEIWLTKPTSMDRRVDDDSVRKGNETSVTPTEQQKATQTVT